MNFQFLIRQSADNFQKNRGQAALLAVILIMVLMLSAVFGATALALKETSAASQSLKSRFAFFTAEAGIDDAVYRFKQGKTVTPQFSLDLNGSTAVTTITTPTLSEKIIQSNGDSSGAVRAIQTKLSVIEGIAFHYGVQVGNGGFTLGQNSKIEGNVFSNGDIEGSGPTKSRITGNAQVAGSHEFEHVKSGSVAAGKLNDCVVYGQAYYVSSTVNCTASSTQQVAVGVPAQNFPITNSQIDNWKADAAAQGEISGYSLASNNSASLGPKKITGDVTLGNNSVLTLTGTLWITGTITFGNSSKIKLDSSYGANNGFVIVDGRMDFGNGARLLGSGVGGSYIMVIDTYSSLGDAITVGNNASSTVFYAPNGTVSIGNGLKLKEVMGYQIDIGNNSTVTYDTGLANSNFYFGPGGDWNMSFWKEIVP